MVLFKNRFAPFKLTEILFWRKSPLWIVRLLFDALDAHSLIGPALLCRRPFWWLASPLSFIFLSPPLISSIALLSPVCSLCGSLTPLISSLALLSPVSSLLSRARQQEGGRECCFIHHRIGRRLLTLEAGDGPGHCRLFLVFSSDFLGAFCSSDSSAIWGKFLGEIGVRIFVIIAKEIP